MSQATLDHRMNIRTIVWPIFVEQILRMSMMTVDVFMLSRYSVDAVAAVGLVSNFIFVLALTYMVASTGAAILIGQNLGAQRPREASAYAGSALLMSLLLAVLLGALSWVGSSPLLGLFNLEAAVELYSHQYLQLVAAFSIGMAVSIVLSTILRAYGYSKSPMVIQLVAGLINVVGNYIALFGPFGIPPTGVVGVAVATIVCQLFAAIASLLVIKHHRLPLSLRSALRFDGQRMKEILRLGLPNAGESFSYDLAQVVIMFFVAQLGTAALAATAVAQTLSRFMYVFSLSLGNGTQILSSYLIGQSRFMELKQKVHAYWKVGLLISFGVTLLMALGREPLAALFSEDLQTQRLIGGLILISLLLEPGRAINLVVISALKGTADVVFPVKIGVVCMWGIGVAGAWLFGIHWAWGVVGIWFGVALDEWTRALIVIGRWQREKWIGMSQVQSRPASAESEPDSEPEPEPSRA